MDSSRENAEPPTTPSPRMINDDDEDDDEETARVGGKERGGRVRWERGKKERGGG